MTKGEYWKRRKVQDNDGKPLTVWSRDGLEIAQDSVSLEPHAMGTEMVFNIYTELGEWLGEAATLHGAKSLARKVRVQA